MTRYPFRFTSSSHSLQVKLSSHFSFSIYDFQYWCLVRSDMQKDYFCPGTDFWLKNVRTICLKQFSRLRFQESIIWCFMHEYSDIGTHRNLSFSILKQNFHKMTKICWFLKNVRIFIQKSLGTTFPGYPLFACLKYTDLRNHTYILHLRRSVINWQRWAEVRTHVDNSISCLGWN